MRANRVVTWPRGWALLALVALTALSAPTVALLSAGPANAAGFSMSAILDSNTALTFLVTNNTNNCTSQMTLTITAGATPVTPTSTVNQNVNTVLVTLPAGTPSPVTFVGNCNDVEVPISSTAQGTFATVNVTKQVQGPDPATATFTVHFDCAFPGFPHFTGDLQYGSTGGTTPFYLLTGGATCTLTETNTGGAQSTSITPNPFTVDIVTVSATVTNTFPAAAAAPAAALVVAPQFTG
jgi:Domain of unknown function (DUF5979)